MTQTVNVQELNELIRQESAFVDIINFEVQKVIVGQKHLLEGLMIGMLSDGHILLEGVPGLAKTLAINTLANSIQAGFRRIQFTPDLLPADLIGTILSLPMKLTGLPLKCSQHCSKPCRSGRLLLVIKPIPSKSHFLLWLQ